MVELTSTGALAANPDQTTQQEGPIRRLYDTMQRYRGLALAIAQPAVLVAIAILLILVVLPAAVGAQADTIR